MEENKYQKIKKHPKDFKKKIKWAIVIVIIVAIAIVTTLYKTGVFEPEPEPEIMTSSDLYKVLDVDNLYTYKETYSDVCTVKSESEGGEYYALYKATANVGIDVKQISIDPQKIDDNHILVTISIPKVTLDEPNVDIASLKYMFNKKSQNTGTVSKEAYVACIEDAKEKMGKENSIYEIAQKRVEETIKMLVQPFFDNAQKGGINYELKFEVKGGSDNEKN